MHIQTNTIFYFSGTGNSLQVAKSLTEQLKETHLQPMASLVHEQEIQVDAECIGFVFPVYMLGIPMIVAEFIKKIKLNPSTYVFTVVTCGGLPGMAFKQIDQLLKPQSTHIHSAFVVKMPGNNIRRYEAKSDEDQVKLFQQAAIDVQNMSTLIQKRQAVKIENSHPLITNLLAPVLYKKLQNQSETLPDFQVTPQCIGCGLCQKVCPVKNIQMIENRPKWGNNCQQCMACIQHCPKEAIEYGKKTVGRKRYKNPNINVVELIL